MPYIIGTVISLALFSYTFLGKHLTLSGASLIAIIVALYSIFELWNMLALLLITYITLMIIDKATLMKRNLINYYVVGKSGARSAKQILANGLIPLLATALYFYFEDRVYLIVFAIGVGATLADSAASDIGVLSKGMPRDICSFKNLTPGLSGGVSGLGIFVSIVMSLIFGFIAFVCIHLSINESLIVVAFSFIGSLIDSLLGSKMQAKYQCVVCECFTEKATHCDVQTRHAGGFRIIDNCMVNLLSSIIVSGLSFVWLIGGH
jgi:uncharacterized protein (TIGR00297 family)